VHPDAQVVERLGQHPCGRRVELLPHEVGVEMYHRDREPAAGQPAGGLETENSAAQDHCVPGVDRARDHLAAVIDGAQDVHVARRLVT